MRAETVAGKLDGTRVVPMALLPCSANEPSWQAVNCSWKPQRDQFAENGDRLAEETNDPRQKADAARNGSGLEEDRNQTP